MRRALLIWLACSLVGGAVLALPDDGPRLVAFSGAHGLTLLDSVGVAILLAGWIPTIRYTTSRRRGGPQGTASSAAPLLGGLGLGLVIASAFEDFAGWWAVGAVILVAAQLLAMIRAGERPRDS